MKSYILYLVAAAFLLHGCSEQSSITFVLPVGFKGRIFIQENSTAPPVAVLKTKNDRLLKIPKNGILVVNDISFFGKWNSVTVENEEGEIIPSESLQEALSMEKDQTNRFYWLPADGDSDFVAKFFFGTRAEFALVCFE